MKSKLDKKQFTELIESGSPITKACKLLNIHRSTFYDWLDSDIDFRIEYIKAKSHFKEDTDDVAGFLYHKKVREGDRRYHMKWLNEQHPEYMRKKIDIVFKLKDNISEGVSKSMDKEELFELARALDNTGFDIIDSIPKNLRDEYWIWFFQNYPGDEEHLKHNPRWDFVKDVMDKNVKKKN